MFRAKYLGTVVAVKAIKRGLTDSAIDTFIKVRREREGKGEGERKMERVFTHCGCLQEISVMSKLHHPHVVLLMGTLKAFDTLIFIHTHTFKETMHTYHILPILSSLSFLPLSLRRVSERPSESYDCHGAP